jgi:CBS domain-containing protein
MFDTEPGLPPGLLALSTPPVSEIARRPVTSLSPAANLVDVARAVSSAHGAPVVIAEAGRPLGVVRAAEVVRVLLGRFDGRAAPATTVMSSTVFCVRHDAPLRTAVELIVQGAPEVLVLDASGACVGVVLAADVAAALAGDGLPNDPSPAPRGGSKALA